MEETYRREIVQRVIRNLLDIQILRSIRAQPMWGYKIKKQTEARFGVKLRHGALYPMLNMLEKESFLTSHEERRGGRTRKVYSITNKGEVYVDAYDAVLREQLEKKDLE